IKKPSPNGCGKYPIRPPARPGVAGRDGAGRDGRGMKGAALAPASVRDPLLRGAYERCRQLNARHGKTYYLATKLLPPAKRPAVHALYGLARWADDIVDDVAPGTPPRQ